MYRTVALLSALVCFPMVFTGCVSGPTIWTPETTSEMTIDAAGLSRLKAETHNGMISYDGSAESASAINITVTKRGGGGSIDEAEAALEAVDVFVEDIADGGKRIAWRWSKPRGLRWGAEVEFHIKGPAGLTLAAETHNGRIAVTHHKADVNLVTYNGRIEVASEGDTLCAATHNGRITAESSASNLTLVSYNGRVEANLGGAKNVGGEITTHNGSILLRIGNDTSFDLDCDTHNGDIDFDVPVTVQKLSSDHIKARIGDGGSRLDVETYNGNIKIKNAG